MKTSNILFYFDKLESDTRITVWHLAILYALIAMAAVQGRRRQIKVSRSKIMEKSHITTTPTYHKYFRELQDFGYLSYRPSYHPGVRSEVDIL